MSGFGCTNGRHGNGITDNEQKGIESCGGDAPHTGAAADTAQGGFDAGFEHSASRAAVRLLQGARPCRTRVQEARPPQ